MKVSFLAKLVKEKRKIKQFYVYTEEVPKRIERIEHSLGVWIL